MAKTNEYGLTMKQEGYLQSRLKGASQREAYKENYNCKNMTDKTIDECACRLEANHKVNARWKMLTARLEQKATEEGLLTATDVLKGIADIVSRNAETDDKTALAALTQYGKHLKLFTDRTENVNLNHDLTEDEADEVLKSFGIDPASVKSFGEI